MLPPVPISPYVLLVVLACKVYVKEHILGWRALLALLFHLCINSWRLDFPALEACSWPARRSSTKTGKVSGRLRSGAAACMFLLTLVPMPEPWEACTRLKRLRPTIWAPCICIALPGASVRALSPGTRAVWFGAGLPVLAAFCMLLPVASSAICPQQTSKQSEDRLQWGFKYPERVGDRWGKKR